MSHEEFKSQSFGYRPDLRNESQLQQTPVKYADVEIPNSVDWHAKGAVTKVKNQAQVPSTLGHLIQRSCMITLTPHPDSAGVSAIPMLGMLKDACFYC